MNDELENNFKQWIESGPYAWPGGYPTFALCEDGEALCHKCCLENANLIVDAIREGCGGWYIVAIGVNWEDDNVECAHCDEKIACAYPGE